MKQDDDHFWFCFADSTASNGCGLSAVTTVRSTTLATTGTWFHVAAVKSSSEIAIYVNGVKEGTQPLPLFHDTNSANLRIGSNAQYGAFLNGLVDEVEVFNRALSASEIQAIFSAGSAGKCKQPQTTLSVALVNATYGGTANLQATLTRASDSTAVSGETISFTLNSNAVLGSPTTNTSGVATITGASLTGINAGTYPTGVGASFAGDTNFTASSGTAQLKINQAPLTITANNAARPYGAPNPSLGATYSAFVTGEGPSNLTGTLNCTTTATSGNGAASPGSLPGPYPITCSGQTSNNYNINYVAGTLTVLSAPLVSLSPTSLVFPNQLLGIPSGQRTVTLKNVGTALLNIASIGISGDFLQTNTCGITVAVNASCIIRVRFTPTATGTRNGAVTITDNAYGSPQMVSLTGTGIAAVIFPGNVTFAARRVGTTSSPQLVFLININNAAMAITGVAITGPNSGDFSQTNNCVPSLSARSPCIIRVSFSPKATGSRTGTLQITDSDPSSPQSVGLKGTGR